MRRAVGPYQIVERRDQFEVRDGRTILSKHATYLDAEDAALRAWLRKYDDEDRDHARPSRREPNY